MCKCLLLDDNGVSLAFRWADGMGNENENKLPACQLDKIQAAVTDSYTKRHISTARRYHRDYSPGHSGGGSLDWWGGDKWDEPLPGLAKEEVDVGFWIDTLCVPRGADLRRRAIAEMRKIYESAHRVLVLDATIMDVTIDADITTKVLPSLPIKLPSPTVDSPRGHHRAISLLPTERWCTNGSRTPG
jgi:hypothetical protein